MSRPIHQHAICLGCGCVCDDIELKIDTGGAISVQTKCSLGRSWFRDGRFPEDIFSDGITVPLDQAVLNAAEILFANPRRTLVYIADDVNCAGQAEATALADRIGATVDGPTSDTVAGGLLAAQRRGRASATLGELRHRADVVIFWGVDPLEKYPRFMERFVSGPPAFAESRRLIAIDVDDARGPHECDERIALSLVDEVDALSIARATLKGRATSLAGERFSQTVDLMRRLKSKARYIAIVFDAEPGQRDRDPAVAEGLIALTQTLNASTRAALFALRAGGNRNGLESVLTWQTGYPFAVEFSSGHPRYTANETVSDRIARGRYDAAVIIGSTDALPDAVLEMLRNLPTVVIGPNASASGLEPRVAIDTGVTGIHDAGLVLRMDDVPLETQTFLSHPRSMVGVLRMLNELSVKKSASLP